jgi:hypothetical protein
MKLKDLLEAPMLDPSEMPDNIGPMRPFISMDTVKRDFSVIAHDFTGSGEEYFVVLRKHTDNAVIGLPGVRRPDKKVGIDVFGEVSFKHSVRFTGMQTFDVGRQVIQVDSVRVGKDIQKFGWGLYLYLSLARAGYVVISDNKQYIGGKELWKKIASNVVDSKYKVYVIDSGNVRLDPAGKPVVYDGHNIDDAELWSLDASRKYTLFALRSEMVI